MSQLSIRLLENKEKKHLKEVLYLLFTYASLLGSGHAEAEGDDRRVKRTAKGKEASADRAKVN